MLFVKRIEGLEKSCLMANMPTSSGGKVLFLDAGANVGMYSLFFAKLLFKKTIFIMMNLQNSL